MTRAVGNGLIKTLADTIGTGAVGKLAKQVAQLSRDVANIKTPDKGSGLMFNPETEKLYIPCGNGVTVNKVTGMLEVPIGEHLRYTGSGLDVPDADETTAGVVKLTHEVSNRDDGEWAITADGVYAYAPDKKTANVFPYKNLDLLNKTAGLFGDLIFANCTFNFIMSYYTPTTELSKDALLFSADLSSINGTFSPLDKMFEVNKGYVRIVIADNMLFAYRPGTNNVPEHFTFSLPVVVIAN